MHRYTVYAEKDIPLGHAASLQLAQRMACRMPDARFIVKRLKAYPFTHVAKFPLRGA